MGRVGVAVPPWLVAVGDATSADRKGNAVVGVVTGLAPRGGLVRVTVAGPPVIVADVAVDAPEVAGLTVGATVAVTWPAAATRLVPESDGAAAGRQ